MKFIIGGEFQGKFKYALDIANASLEEACDISKEEYIKSKKIIYNLNLFIKNNLAEGKTQEEIEKIIYKLINENLEIVIVSTEIGYGIVPMNKFDRSYREVTGRICCMIAQKATEVHRVICGVGTVIKGEGKN